jgi:2,4-dienoyl-CoA reductase-like NADH-dependent reductase (Old Yellow Enzyme family)
LASDSVCRRTSKSKLNPYEHIAVKNRPLYLGDKMNPNNRVLFSSRSIGNVEIKNRFVRSATFESAANDDGTIGDDYINLYHVLAKGEIGLIITGMIYTSIDGKGYPRQAGLHSDQTIGGLSDMTKSVHETGSKIFAELCHGGRQSLVQGLRPMAPSAGRPDIIYRVYPKTMTSNEILNVIKTFGSAAKRAKQANFDGVQIHAAHGYLLSQFLSPFFNRRRDQWGGSSEKRFNLLRHVFQSVKESAGSAYPTIVKINVEDYTPKPGLSLAESAEHVQRLVELGVDAVEISCGTLAFSAFNQFRGNVPVQALAKVMPTALQPLARLSLRMAYPASFCFPTELSIGQLPLLSRPASGYNPCSSTSPESAESPFIWALMSPPSSSERTECASELGPNPLVV